MTHSWIEAVKQVADLVEENKSLKAENERLQATQKRLVSLLENELDGLLGGDEEKPRCLKPKPIVSPKTTKKSKPKADNVARSSEPRAKRSPAKKAKYTKVGTVLTRKDGRRFTRTAKVAKARKLQGQYIGNLRKITTKKERAKIQTIARNKGIPAALDAISKAVAAKE